MQLQRVVCVHAFHGSVRAACRNASRQSASMDNAHGLSELCQYGMARSVLLVARMETAGRLIRRPVGRVSGQRVSDRQVWRAPLTGGPPHVHDRLSFGRPAGRHRSSGPGDTRVSRGRRGKAWTSSSGATSRVGLAPGGDTHGPVHAVRPPSVGRLVVHAGAVPPSTTVGADARRRFLPGRR